MTLTTPIRAQSVIPSLALVIIYLRTKFGNYRCSSSRDIRIENESHDLDHAFLGVVCHL